MSVCLNFYLIAIIINLLTPYRTTLTYCFKIKIVIVNAGGLAEEVTEKLIHSVFIPFGDVVDINLPLDYETEKHRGFAFVGQFIIGISTIININIFGDTNI